MQLRINFTHLSGKPKRVRIQVRITQSTLSYAFCISNLMPTIPLIPFFPIHRVNHFTGKDRIFFNLLSKHESRLVWRFQEINLTKKGFNQSTIILEISLYIVLHRLIGRRCLNSKTPFSFEMRTTKVLFMSLRRILERNTFWTIFTISEPTILQYFWKNKAGIPSGSRAFIGCILFKAFQISTSAGIVPSRSASSLKTTTGIKVWRLSLLNGSAL